MNNWRNRIISSYLRHFFYLLYNQFAWSYDLVANIASVGLWQEWVLSIQAYLPGPNILELGHGPGHLQQALLTQENSSLNSCVTNHPFCIVGLDSSHQMSRLARRRLDKANLPRQLVLAYAQSLPFPRGIFDQVTATFPSEYIFAEVTVREISRVLSPSGSAIILLQAQITGKHPIQRLAGWLFQVTGQANEVDKIWRIKIQNPFIQAGLRTRVEEIILPESKILIVIAQKMET